MKAGSTMSVGEALALARSLAPAMSCETVPVPQAAGRVLAEDVRAGRDLPPVTSSAWTVGR